MMSRFVLAALIMLVPASPSIAIEPDEVLADPVLETRAREISKELRCVVCQNQSIDDSHAEIARDMRVLVRERLVAGDTDEEVVEFMVARYGEYVRFSPSIRFETLPLWFGPPVLVLIVIAAFVMVYRAQQNRTAAEGVRPLSAAERARLDALVEQYGGDDKPGKPGDTSR